MNGDDVIQYAFAVTLSIHAHIHTWTVWVYLVAKWTTDGLNAREFRGSFEQTRPLDIAICIVPGNGGSDLIAPNYPRWYINRGMESRGLFFKAACVEQRHLPTIVTALIAFQVRLQTLGLCLTVLQTNS